jgi:alkanesulfonate monooxygenase SsuD/methylene tetrahydromethanopterin reductase-like flavin-dependent oxidoreductase (luciferase family)
LAAVAATTERVGLIPSVSTTYNPPYAFARRMASLDHISRGRAGWNMVTSSQMKRATSAPQVRSLRRASR